MPSSGYWNITLDTVTRRAISVTRKPSMQYSIKIGRAAASAGLCAVFTAHSERPRSGAATGQKRQVAWAERA